MSTSPKDVLEKIKDLEEEVKNLKRLRELQEQRKNLKREVEQPKTVDDKKIPRKIVSKVPNVNPTSKYVGVKWHNQGRKWHAQIMIGGKSTYLGLDQDEEKAARMYDKQAVLQGKPVNFPLHEGMKKAVKRTYNRREKNKKKTSQEDIDGSNSEDDPEPKRQKTDG